MLNLLEISNGATYVTHRSRPGHNLTERGVSVIKTGRASIADLRFNQQIINAQGIVPYS